MFAPTVSISSSLQSQVLHAQPLHAGPLYKNKTSMSRVRFSDMASLGMSAMSPRFSAGDAAPAASSSAASSIASNTGATGDAAPMSRVDHFKEGLKNVLYVPILPAVGYLALDATGVSSAIAADNAALKAILGEGFGHAGLCFSLHFVLKAGYHFWKTIRG